MDNLGEIHQKEENNFPSFMK
jgi:hypothetical protein